MKNFSICLSLLISFLKVRTEDIECWSAPEYPCCPNEKVVVTDSQGTWGVVNGEWCGISPRKKCFAEFLGYKCCENDYGTVSAIDEDGSWYYDDKKKEWCGYRNSTSRWNNRESNKDTLEEYNDFKIKWNEKERDNFERLSVVVGEDESMINFGWYSTTNSSSSIFFGTKKDMSDAKTYNGTSVFYKEINGNPYYSNKVTVTGLERNSIYYYQRKLNGIYEETIKMNTYNPYNFSAIFVGDPQIGASNGRVNVEKQYKLTVENGTLNDAFNWNDTVYRAFNFVKQPSLFITTGDHVETDLRKLNNKFDPYNDPQEILYDDYIQETQYSAYFLPEILKTIPSVPTLGNHDSHTSNYMYHFNTPNSSIPKEKNPNIVNVPGYSYFYKYNNVLFVVYESNYETCDDFKIVTEKAFKKYPNMDWNIALFHHDIYGMGEAHSQEDHVINELRPCLTPLLDQYKFDLAINGHDHIYSSSHFILYNQNYDSSTSTPLYSLNKIEKNKIYTNPSGILYITANSATGSKYNQVITDSKKYGIDYIYQAKQDYTTSFGVLEFEKLYGKIRLNITSYDANNYSKVDGPFIIEKIIDDNEKCWSEKLGYACCTETTYVEYTDKSGKWGVENDKWCGIIDSPTPTPTPTPTPNPVVDEPINCWSKKLGYPCCSQTTIIELTDKDGNWGVENDGWCGIIDNSIPTPTPTPITEPEPENCWAIKLGYKCCSQTNKIKYTDKSGKWGVENNEWCGLL